MSIYYVLSAFEILLFMAEARYDKLPGLISMLLKSMMWHLPAASNKDTWRQDGTTDIFIDIKIREETTRAIRTCSALFPIVSSIATLREVGVGMTFLRHCLSMRPDLATLLLWLGLFFYDYVPAGMLQPTLVKEALTTLFDLVVIGPGAVVCQMWLQREYVLVHRRHHRAVVKDDH